MAYYSVCKCKHRQTYLHIILLYDLQLLSSSQSGTDTFSLLKEKKTQNNLNQNAFYVFVLAK